MSMKPEQDSYLDVRTGQVVTPKETDFPLCKTHDSRDTNGDGLCIRYGTARKEIRERLGECRYGS